MNKGFDRELKETLMEQLKVYFAEELDRDLGNFEAEFLLDFLSEQLGPHYYNQALRDVQIHLSGYLDTLNERIDELEQIPPKKS